MASSIPNPKNPNSTLERDSNGRFVKSTTPKVSVTIKSNTPIATPNPISEEPLVAFKINNPLTKLMKWIDYIRKHQATTLAFKVTVPLIALPVILITAYKLGFNKATILNSVNTPSPNPNINISRAGTLRLTYTPSGIKHLLVLKDDTALTLHVPVSVNLDNFINKRVLVTGTLNLETNVLSVDSIEDFEILPSPTITQTPTPTPRPTS